jgi:hypothetical protein
MAHGGRLNDLLALDFVHRYPDAGVRYVINHPGVVATSFAGEYDGAPATAEEVAHLRTVGKPVEVAVRQILPFLDGPGVGDPTSRELLTAVLEGVAVRLDPVSWSVTDARRLHEITRKLLLALPDGAPGAGSGARA